MLRFIILSLLLSSCSNYLDIEESNGITTIKSMNLTVNSVSNVKWNIGNNRQDVVSKGFRVKVNIPKINVSDIPSKIKANKWLYRIERISGRNKRTIGYYHFNLASIGRTTSEVTFNVYYHAASVSREFRSFKCPAFNHRLKIKSILMQRYDVRRQKDVYLGQRGTVKGYVSKSNFVPLIFSGGTKLKGTYLVSVALYDSKTKLKYSDWIAADHIIVVSSDEQVSSPSCIGEKPELD